MQHALRARCLVSRFSLLSETNDPFGCLVAVDVEIIQVLGHVLVVGVGGTNGVAWLAVFAKDASVSIRLETCKFLC